MRYQLVLQFRGDTISDFDRMIEIEDCLTESLAELAVVDGHDVGANETNIFILTSNPGRTFDASVEVLQRAGCLDSVTAAYRLVEKDNYTVLWPKGTTRFRVT